MDVSGIYKIQSIIKQERFYIGSSGNIRKRKWEHLCRLRNNKHPNKKLQYHFNKYGESDLELSVIETCLPIFLAEREQHYFNPLPWFNNDPNAFSSLGIKRSDEYKKAMSERMKGNKIHLGHKHSKETKKKMSENSGCRGSKWNIGRKHTEEECKKMSVFQQQRKNTLIHNQHIKEGWVKRKQREAEEKTKESHSMGGVFR